MGQKEDLKTRDDTYVLDNKIMDNVKYHMKRLGMNVHDLSRSLGCHRTTVARALTYNSPCTTANFLEKAKVWLRQVNFKEVKN